MPEVKGWLSLKIQDNLNFGYDSLLGAGFKPAPTLLISVPKKIVHLATQRNKIKRLIREAFRQEDYWDLGKVYLFRVVQNPRDVGLKEAKNAINQLISSSSQSS